MTFAISLLAAPVTAQEQPEADMGQGLSLMEEGARMLMRGLLNEMEPTIDELRDSFEAMGPAFAEFVQSVGPAFSELLSQVDDLRNYEAPEFLPNGDIIMRRRPDAPIWVPEDSPPDIEL